MSRGQTKRHLRIISCNGKTKRQSKKKSKRYNHGEEFLKSEKIIKK